MNFTLLIFSIITFIVFTLFVKNKYGVQPSISASIMETKQEIKIRVKHAYSKKDIAMMDEAQIRFGLNLALMDKLVDENIISYLEETDPSGEIEKIAEINILK